MYAGSAAAAPASAATRPNGTAAPKSPSPAASAAVTASATAPSVFSTRTTSTGLTYATSTSACTSTTASSTPGSARSACSISPSSIRWPRSFTWKSSRPPNSSSPSAHKGTVPIYLLNHPSICIGVPAHAVARAVDDAAARRVGLGPQVGHEALGGELGPVEVAARHLHAAQPQLAPHTDRLQQGR
eukprot:scaffold10237_cov52-Phaeocystis_antarctica.AAC.1